MRNKQRIDSLQVVRAIAFIGVYLYHAIRTFPGEGPIYNFFAKSLGPWGVSVFFCLSGFLMTFSYWDRSAKCSLKDSALFSAKKIKQLYPLHLIMIFVGAVYLYLSHESIIGIVKRLIITIPLMQTWLPVGYQAINSVAWYLSVCLFLYFCFPFVLKTIRQIKSSTRSMIVIVAIWGLQLLIGLCVYKYTNIDIKWVTYCHPVFRLGDFVIGCLLAFIYKNRNFEQIDGWKCSILEIIAIIFNIVVCVYYTIASDATVWFTYTCLFIPSSVLLVYAFSLDSGIISRLLKNKVVLWFASISPYAFLIHRLVIYYFHAFIKHVLNREQISFLLVVFVPFLITTISVYLYIFFEKGVIQKIVDPVADDQSNELDKDLC